MLASLRLLASFGKLDFLKREEEGGGNLCGVLAPGFCTFNAQSFNSIDPTNDHAHNASFLLAPVGDGGRGCRRKVGPRASVSEMKK